MVIFHSYVKLPEGNNHHLGPTGRWRTTNWIDRVTSSGVGSMGRSPGVHRQNRRGSQWWSCWPQNLPGFSHGVYWMFHDFPCFSMSFSMLFHKFPCLPRIFHNFPWFVTCLLNLFWDSFKTCQDWSCGFVRKHGNGVNMFRPYQFPMRIDTTLGCSHLWTNPMVEKSGPGPLVVSELFTMRDYDSPWKAYQPTSRMTWENVLFLFAHFGWSSIFAFFSGTAGSSWSCRRRLSSWGACNCIGVLGLIYV